MAASKFKPSSANETGQTEKPALHQNQEAITHPEQVMITSYLPHK